MKNIIDLKFDKIVNRFYKQVENKKYGNRYKSWEHCRKFFIENKYNLSEKSQEEQTKIKDNMCLHLAFYLASWGMYRGSSFLLQNDYKIFYDIIEVLLKVEDEWYNYNPFKDDCEKDFPDIFFIDQINNKKTSILSLLTKIKTNTNQILLDENIESDSITDTLLTKIILGTVGCLPAFDRYLKKGLWYCGFKQTYNNKNLKILIHELREIDKKNNVISKTINEIIDKNKLYTPLKIVDMFFWEIGYELSLYETIFMLKQKINILKKREKNKINLIAQKLEVSYDNQNYDKICAEILQKIEQMLPEIEKNDIFKKIQEK